MEAIYFFDKNDFKKTASKCSLALVLFVVAEYALIYVLTFVIALLKNRNGIEGLFSSLLEVMAEKNTGLVIDITASLISFFIVFLIVFGKMFKETLKGRAGFDEKGLVSVGKGICALMLSAYVGALVFMAFNFILNLFGHNYDAEAVLNIHYEGAYHIVFAVYGCIIAPVIEELICRGFVLGSLKKYSNEAAIVISAVMFAVMHGVYAQFPVAFLAGLVLGCAAVYSGSVTVTVLMHIIYNSAVMFIEESEAGNNMFLTGGLLLLMLAAYIYGAVVIVKAVKKAVWADGKITTGLYGMFFGRIPVLLFLAAHIVLGAYFIN